jgi:hypothetical protein
VLRVIRIMSYEGYNILGFSIAGSYRLKVSMCYRKIMIIHFMRVRRYRCRGLYIEVVGVKV